MTPFILSAVIATQNRQRPVLPATLGLEHGTRDIEAGPFTLRLGNDAGVAVSLLPHGGKEFDFLPGDRLTARAADGFVHLGDVSFRSGGASYSTYAKRKPLAPPVATDGSLSYDLSATLPADCPLKVSRVWAWVGGHLQLRFTFTNLKRSPIEIGSLGIAMPFNNIISDRSLEQAHAICSFTDPYIGEDAGYLRVTQLSGTGQTMVVVPVGKTPLEAWHLVNEPMRPNQTFEGMMEWMVHTKAYADNEWKGVEQWNTPTDAIIKPDETLTYGVEFLPTQSVRTIEDTLTAAKRPVAVGLPGYVLPMDQDGKLFLKYVKGVKSLAVEPSGALEWVENKEGKKGWRGYTVHGKTWGQARLTVTYGDDTRQVVSYDVIKPAAQTVADLGHFLTTKSWFTDTADPFGRAPGPISYDREVDKQVVQDSRVWIAGLGDEGGSGSWVAAMMKAFGQPRVDEVEKLESFVDGVIWGNLQFKEGANKYGVRKSVFYYDPALLPNYPYNPNFNWKSWTSWSKKQTDDVGRGYNYPHVVAAYWSMYRIARNHPGMVKSHDWKWYLDQAHGTTEFLTSKDAKGEDRVGYWRLGLMEGDIFLALLDDLRREGWTEKAALIEARMKDRADHWSREAYPFGSEMAWDSTGQEEVYSWCKFFGFEDKAQVSLNSILAYDPTVPHWGYNGNARRYWDFLYGAKLSRIERQIHHYGSGLNAIPLLNEYREHPSDLYLLRVGYGGTMGALSNIDQEGFASAAFHSFPSTLKWDAYSGDYGPNFFGHAWNTGTYLVETPDFGWQAFGGNVSRDGDWVSVACKDSFRNRVFLASVGLYLVLDAGAFESVAFNPKTRAVRVRLSAADAFTPAARLRIQGSYRAVGSFASDAGALTIPLGAGATDLELVGK